MTTAAVERPTAETATAPPKPVTLADELALRGITVLDGDAVFRYQQEFREKMKAEYPDRYWPDWQSIAFFDYVRLARHGGTDTAGESYSPIPVDVARTIARAREIPGSEIEIERFDRDPFVRVDRYDADRSKRESCYIAFWDAPGFQP